jgi:hypothetical protein
MPLDSILPPSPIDLPAAARLRVHAALEGWEPRAIESPGRFRPLAALRTALALLRRPLSDKGLGLCY